MKIYITREEFEGIIKQFDDYRDKLLFELVWHGNFKNGYDSLINIKTVVTEDKNLKKLVAKSLKEKEVTNYSMKDGIPPWKETLIESDYLLRERESYLKRKDISINKNFNGFAMNRDAIINRVTTLKRVFPALGVQSLQTIYVSGVIDRTINSINLKMTENVQREMAMKHLLEKECLKKGRAYLYWKAIKQELIDRGMVEYY